MKISPGTMPHRRRRPWLSGIMTVFLGCQLAAAIELSSIDDPNAVQQAASTATWGMVKWYTGNNTGDTPGNLPAPYYWWQAGAFMMGLVDYWYYTGDSSYNKITTEAIQWQTGPNADFMTPNQTKSTGNDDQSFWGFAAMDAAELRYPNPPEDEPQWLALAQAVFNDQTTRWDTGTCGGGLRWQVYSFNPGWDYKNGISNGCYFSMGARLARYTGNQSYADHAERMYNWVREIGIVDDAYKAYDGSDASKNCSGVNHIQWTYNAGVFLHGAANMWNFTQDPIWKTRVDGFVAALEIFFEDDVMVEIACEPGGNCNNDQRSFKAYLSRWMAATAQLCPWTADNLMGKLQKSAIAAAKNCNTGFDGNQCTLAWLDKYVPKWLGIYGPGEQMAASAVIGANLIGQRPGPVTKEHGGISKGDPGAGTAGDATVILGWNGKIDTGDRVGAGIVTTIICVGIMGGAWWMVA